MAMAGCLLDISGSLRTSVNTGAQCFLSCASGRACISLLMQRSKAAVKLIDSIHSTVHSTCGQLPNQQCFRGGHIILCYTSMLTRYVH